MSTNGPDWMDVRAALKSVERAHECRCSIALYPCGKHDGSDWYIAVSAQREGQLTPEEMRPALVQVQWPNRSHRTMEGAAFDAVYKLDNAISRQWYEQAEFPF